MLEYFVTNTHIPPNWGEIAPVFLTECVWSPNSAPDVSVQCARTDDGLLLVRLHSYSPPSRAVNTTDDSPVYQDNCLEFFFDAGGGNYINLEANSASALLAFIGPDRFSRTPLSKTRLERPTVKSMVFENGWEAVFTVPASLVAPNEMRANFYSCGDKTEAPYYSSWNKVETERPDFHRPEFFGMLKF